MAVNHRQPPTNDLKCSKFGNLLALCLPKLPNHVVWNRVVSYCFEIEKINTMFPYKSSQFSIHLFMRTRKKNPIATFIPLNSSRKVSSVFRYWTFQREKDRLKNHRVLTYAMINSFEKRSFCCSQIDSDRIKLPNEEMKKIFRLK